MKRGLHQTPLAVAILALAGEQSIAQKSAGAFEHPALLEIRLVRDQNVLDRLWIADQVDPLSPHPQEHEVAVLARRPMEKLRRRFSEFGENTQPRPASRTRWV